MKLIENLKRKLKKSSAKKGLDIYYHLIKTDYPELNSLELIEKINSQFNVNFTSGDLYLLEEPTVNEMEEDLRLIYKHNNITI